MVYFCTYFDHHYLPRGLALYHSLKEHCHEFILYILCLSDSCYSILNGLNLPCVRLVAQRELEYADSDLLKVKQNRSLIEYYFTCTPSLPLYIFNEYPGVDLITYIDSDLYFFSDPTPLFQEIKKNSVAIIAHRFPPHLQQNELTGKYNVGWLSFRRDQNGLACLKWHRKKCIEWCYDVVEEGRYADQKYLDYFSEYFNGVIELKHKGANLAPWNIDNYNITVNSHHIMVDGDQLIFYHFHKLKHFFNFLYDSGFSIYNAKLTKIITNKIYLPYLDVLVNMQKKYAPKQNNGNGINGINGIRGYGKSRYQIIHEISPKIFKVMKKFKHILKTIQTRTFVIYFG